MCTGPRSDCNTIRSPRHLTRYGEVKSRNQSSKRRKEKKIKKSQSPYLINQRTLAEDDLKLRMLLSVGREMSVRWKIREEGSSHVNNRRAPYTWLMAHGPLGEVLGRQQCRNDRGEPRHTQGRRGIRSLEGNVPALRRQRYVLIHL